MSQLRVSRRPTTVHLKSYRNESDKMWFKRSNLALWYSITINLWMFRFTCSMFIKCRIFCSVLTPNKGLTRETRSKTLAFRRFSCITVNISSYVFLIKFSLFMTFCCREKCLSFVETLFDVNKEKYLCRITVNPHDDIFSLCTHAFNIRNSYSTCESRGNFDSSSLLKFDKEILNIGWPGSRSSLTQNFLLWRFFVENGKVMFCLVTLPLPLLWFA